MQEHEHPVVSEDSAPSRWLFVSQPSGTFYLAVCHAARHGRPQSLASPSTVTRRGSSPSRPNGNSPVNAAGLEGRGRATVILMEYRINWGQGSCLHSEFSRFLRVMSSRRYMAAGDGGKGKLDLTRHHIDFHSFFGRCHSAAAADPPRPLPSLSPSASHLHFANMQRQVELAV